MPETQTLLHDYLGVTEPEAIKLIAQARKASLGLIKRPVNGEPKTEWVPKKVEDLDGTTTMEITSRTQGQALSIFGGIDTSLAFDVNTLKQINQ